MSRVLVIGGSGFVGGAASRALRDAGHEVVSASRRHRDDEAGIRHVVVDRTDDAALRDVLASVDPEAVVDMACYQPFEAEAMLRAVGDRRYVFGSTVSVYDAGDHAVTEDDFTPRTGGWMPRVENVFSAGVYALGKQWCETVLLGHPEVDWVSVRYPAVFGRGDYTQRITSYMQRIDDGGPLLIPAETAGIPVVVGWSEDMGRATALALEAGASQAAYNVGYAGVAGRAFLAELFTAMGRAPELVEAPLDDVPAAARRYGPRAHIPGIVTGAAERDLGWRPSPLPEAFADTIAWFRDERPSDPDYAAQRPAELELARTLAAAGR